MFYEIKLSVYKAVDSDLPIPIQHYVFCKP